MQQCSVKSTSGRFILLATILASGITFLFGTAITIAIPAIQEEFQASLAEVQWIFNAYTLTLGVLILISGSLSDLFGRKRIFLYGMGVFGVGALLSGFAQSIEMLIVFQVVLGIGAAMMIPGSLAIINVCFLESERGRAIGLWSGLSAGLGALGPLFGGFFTELLDWRFIFFALIPIIILTMFVTLRWVWESKGSETPTIDVWGTLTIALGLFGLTFGLIQNELLYLTVGAVGFVAFLFVEWKSEAPIVPLSIFRSPLVSGANVSTLFLYFALFGTFFFLTLNFQQVQGYSPIFAGLALLPPIIIIGFFSGMAGALADRIGPRIPMVGGPLLVGMGMGFMALAGANTNYFLSFLPGLVLFGSGMTLVIPALTKSALSVEPRFSGAASGVNNAVSRIASLLAISILGVIALSFFSPTLISHLEASSLTPEERQTITVQSDRLAGIVIPQALGEQKVSEVKSAIEESFVSSFRVIMGINALLALFSALIAYITICRRKPGF